jgi:hypothetical protein
MTFPVFTAIADTNTELEQLKQDVRELKAAQTSPTTAANAFNPSIALILMGSYANFTHDPELYNIAGISQAEDTGPGTQGFSLAESELVMSANVDDYFFSRFTLALSPENKIEIEEAFAQTLSLPAGLTFQFGRFYSEFTYLNNKHVHQWDFVDQPLSYRAFLGNQYNDDGIQLRWLAPTDQYIELGSEWFRGDSFPAGGSANKGQGSYSLFIKTGDDVGVSNSWLASAGLLNAESDNRVTDEGATQFTGKTQVLNLDLLWKWAPAGNPYDKNISALIGFMQSSESGNYNFANNYDELRQGAYAQIVYQFIHGWRVAIRYDYLKTAEPGIDFAGTVVDAAGHNPSRTSLMLDYSHSEYSRLRLQYNRDLSSPEVDHQWFLQYTMSLGAHAAHGY